MTAPQSKKDIKQGKEKPPVCKVNLKAIPEELKQFPRWVFWKWIRKKGEWTKVPFDPSTGKKARPNDPSTWATWDIVTKVIARPLTWIPCGRDFDGVGFFFHKDDGFCGTDLDDAIDPATGKLKPWAQKIVDTLDSYTEVSPSGTGVKILTRGKKPGTRCKKGLDDGEVEMYDNARYFCLTGKLCQGVPTTVEERTKQVALVYDDVFGKTPDKKEKGKKKAAETPTVRLAAQPLSDYELIEKATAARNGFKFSRLMNGDISDYGGDHSRADAGFCTMLAFWCDRDPQQMDRIFRSSGLMRAKWDEKRGAKTYGEKTLDLACSGVDKTYGDRWDNLPSQYQPRKHKPAPNATEEEIVAAAIPFDKSSPYDYPDETCPNPWHVLTQHEKNCKIRSSLPRCGCNSCKQCLKRKKRKCDESTGMKIDAAVVSGKQPYGCVRKFTDREWDTHRRFVRRKGGETIRFHLPNGMFAVVATVGFEHSEPMTGDEARAFSSKYIAESVVLGKGKSFYSSTTGWAMARDKKKSQYKKLGNIKMPPQAVRKLCRKHNIKYKVTRPADSGLLVDTFIEHAPFDWKTDDFVQKLLGKKDDELFVPNTNDPVTPKDERYFFRCLPPGIDEYFGWCMDPTG